MSSAVKSIWKKLAPKPAGKWLFSKLVCLKAPYFASIHPRFVELRAGYCELRINKRRAVLNHIGTVHAIAMCNMAELAAGTMVDFTLPNSHRWIPKGMQVEYVKKAETNLRAVAKLEPVPTFGAATDVPVPVEVLDAANQVVFRAVVTMWVSPKKG
ncbi:hotdog fold domain-containing protein [Andreprevotia chitinilytica]|uniref:hotdog fold domain-containing protein n=1 Tax=Andreprevotia chitinilytica TaxID=396808 RepID=UPI000559623F|nr:hotdog fold domain-containing protein [Andreprevotia chitinilytica]